MVFPPPFAPPPPPPLFNLLLLLLLLYLLIFFFFFLYSGADLDGSAKLLQGGQGNFALAQNVAGHALVRAQRLVQLVDAHLEQVERC